MSSDYKRKITKHFGAREGELKKRFMKRGFSPTIFPQNKQKHCGKIST